MRTIEITDNTVDSYVILQPKKQEIGFLPKEESQMFASKSNSWTTPGSNNNQSVVENTLGFVAANAAGQYVLPNTVHTATDYIGISQYEVPTQINSNFASFNIFDLKKNLLIDFYSNTDTNSKITNILNGVQLLRIPANIFNTILTDGTAIAANNDNPLVTNYGKYYGIIKPLFIETKVTGIVNKYHYTFSDTSSFLNSSTGDVTGVANNLRRTIIKTSNNDFKNLPWGFENGSDSGRLFGSIVEVWNNGELKYTKIMSENEFNFSINGTTFNCVLTPDNFGYNPKEISLGDTLRIFPRESYFNDEIFEINYKNPIYNLDQILSYILNDAARDLETGIYEVFDSNGFTLNKNGILQGKVVNSYQITSTDKYELRKRITP